MAMCRNHDDLLEMVVIESLPLRQLLQSQPLTSHIAPIGSFRPQLVLANTLDEAAHRDNSIIRERSTVDHWLTFFPPAIYGP